MKGIALVMGATLLVLGCGTPGKDEPMFDKAEVERLLPLDAKATATITDQASVAKLASFFPGMGQGKKSGIAGGWVAAYRVTFVPAKGQPVKVRVDSSGQAWTEGQGDWRAKAGLKEFLDALVEKGQGKGADAGWSEPVKGLRGRLVRHPLPKCNETEMIGVTLELKNVSTEPLAVQNDPAGVHLQLFGPDGEPVPQAGLPRSGPVPFPQWGVIPRDAYLGFSLYDYGVGVPRGQGALVAILPGGNAWLLKPGKYTLRGTFTFEPPGSGTYRTNAWKGRLDLPALVIEVR